MVLVDDIIKKYNILKPTLHGILYRNQVPKKKEGGYTYYSQTHIDDLLGYLIDTDKFQNHFLLTAAALGSQMLKTYDLGADSEGKPAELTTERIRAFFFDLLLGKIKVKELDGSFSIEQFARTM